MLYHKITNVRQTNIQRFKKFKYHPTEVALYQSTVHAYTTLWSTSVLFNFIVSQNSYIYIYT